MKKVNDNRNQILHVTEKSYNCKGKTRMNPVVLDYDNMSMSPYSYQSIYRQKYIEITVDMYVYLDEYIHVYIS